MNPTVDDVEVIEEHEPVTIVTKGSRDACRGFLNEAQDSLFKALEQIALLKDQDTKDILTRKAEPQLIIAINHLELVLIAMRKRKRKENGKTRPPVAPLPTGE